MTTISMIATFLGAEGKLTELKPDAGAIEILRAASIQDAETGAVSLCRGNLSNSFRLLQNTAASLVIVDNSIALDLNSLAASPVQALIHSDNARLSFMRVIERFFQPKRLSGIHPTAVIAPSAKIAPDVYVGPLCTIGEHVIIGQQSTIHAGVHLYDRVVVGERVTINAGTVIGADGFGYERNESGELEKFPHVGSVIIEDDVEIGANTCIDRGSIGNTYICQGARIDNLVHVAHNVHIGKHTAVIANVMIGGSTRIEDFAWLAPSACLRNKITIGANATVGLAALVTKDVPANETVLGAPAKEAAVYKRLLAELTRLTQDSAR